jgi:hypothetical protein
VSASLTNNCGEGNRTGTCFGDSGGQIFHGDSNVIEKPKRGVDQRRRPAPLAQSAEPWFKIFPVEVDGTFVSK